MNAETLLEIVRHLDSIDSLVDWHCDYAADPNDLSPKDMTAHVNGLVVLETNKIRQLINENTNIRTQSSI